MSTLENATTDVVMNISTSAQMAFVMPKGFDPKDIHSNSHPNTIEFLPYLDGHYISAAAALTGLFLKVLELWPKTIPTIHLQKDKYHKYQQKQRTYHLFNGWIKPWF